jgi:hypothetical protein
MIGISATLSPMLPTEEEEIGYNLLFWFRGP